MPQTQYLCLLRGINVGGKNIIKMSDLKICFENMGFTAVQTYIQSGNIIFSSGENNIGKFTKKIEKILSEKFRYESRVVVVSELHLKKVIEKAPTDFGKFPDKYKYDVVFLKEPLASMDAIKIVSTREGVDTARAGDAVLYFSRLTSRASQSRLSKIISLPEYQYMTIRNWNTTTALLKIMKS